MSRLALGVVLGACLLGLLVAGPALGQEAPPEAWGKAWVKRHAEELGVDLDSERELRLVRSYRTPRSGIWHLVFEQTIGGVRFHGGDLRVHLTANADSTALTVLAATSRLDSRPAPSFDAQVDPIDALEAAAVALGRETPAGQASQQTERVLSVEDEAGTWGEEALVEAVYARGDTGPVPAWRVEMDADGERIELLVDAVSGQVMGRRTLTRHASGLVFDGPHPAARGCPGQGVPQTARPFEATDESPLGWLDGTTTVGPNVEAYENITGSLRGHGDPAPESAPGEYSWPFTDAYASGGPASLDRWAGVTNVFFHANRFHDRMLRAGFDEAAGNFQSFNASGLGRPDDPVRILVQDPLGLNTAATFVPPDGHSQVVRLFKFVEPLWARRDSAFDAQLLVHELGHGVSERLVGTGCFEGIESSALAEGLSDVLALVAFDLPVYGGYVSGNCQQGLRRTSYAQFPYPFHYGLLCNPQPGEGCRPHEDGEIFAAALWYLLNGLEPWVGSREGARCLLDAIVVESLALLPCQPTFLDARDAMLEATQQTAPWLACKVWEAFAAQGMGFGATTDGALSRAPAWDVPGGCRTCRMEPVEGFTVSPTPTNGALLRWPGQDGAERFRIWRQEGGCASHCSLAEARYLGETDSLRFLDQGLSGGSTYGYWISALGTTDVCASRSACVEVTAQGGCTLPPIFDGAPGVTAATALETETCAVELQWHPAEAVCGGAGEAVDFVLYRSEDHGFAPSASNLVSDLPPGSLEGTDSSDGLRSGVTFSYVVRARDGLGNEDANQVRILATPRGPQAGVVTWADRRGLAPHELPETGSEPWGRPGGWTHAEGAAGFRVWQAPPPVGQQAGTPAAAWDLTIGPFAPSENSRLSFEHWYETEPLFDGGVIQASIDGGLSWSDLGESIEEGGYNGSLGALASAGYLLAPDSGGRMWTGTNPSGPESFDQVLVDLSGFAGSRDLRLRFRLLGDDSGGEGLAGWTLRRIQVSDTIAYSSCCPGGTTCREPSLRVVPEAGVCAGEPVALELFTDDPGCGVMEYVWHFGDGTQSDPAPVAGSQEHAYAEPGSHHGVLAVRGAAGCDAEIPFVVEVEENVVPRGQVGNTLLLAKSSGGLRLSWAGSLEPASFNVHGTAQRSLLPMTPQALGTTPVVASVTGSRELELEASAEDLYLVVVGRESCSGLSVFP